MRPRAVNLVDDQANGVEPDAAVVAARICQPKQQPQALPPARRLEIDQRQDCQQGHLPSASHQALRLEHLEGLQRHDRNVVQEGSELALRQLQPLELRDEHLEELGVREHDTSLTTPNALQDLSERCFCGCNCCNLDALAAGLLPPRDIGGELRVEELHQLAEGRLGSQLVADHRVARREGPAIERATQGHLQLLEGIQHEGLAHRSLQARIHEILRSCGQVQGDLAAHLVEARHLRGRQGGGERRLLHAMVRGQHFVEELDLQRVPPGVVRGQPRRGRVHGQEEVVAQRRRVVARRLGEVLDEERRAPRLPCQQTPRVPGSIRKTQGAALIGERRLGGQEECEVLGLAVGLVAGPRARVAANAGPTHGRLAECDDLFVGAAAKQRSL
mmetsp:Transcript_137468/g.439198  ORF Transcript_137468/g.439198 Transcript_137468/m.439198 type:complete len:388 (+) Transcript_137468:1285-2448(+)